MRILTILVCLFFACGLEQEILDVKTAESPTFTDKDLITFQPFMEVDLDIISEASISNAVYFQEDKNNNLYILDILKSKLFKFENESFNVLINSGMKIGDLRGAENFFIQDGLIYANDRYQGLKEFDLDGNYKGITKFPITRNMAVFRKTANGYYCLDYEIQDMDFHVKKWRVSRLNNELKSEKELFSNTLNIHGDPQFDLREILAIDNENNFYFPDSRDNYIINKYNDEGEIVLRFGRKYKRKKYTEETKQIYTRNFEKHLRQNNLPEIAGYPPIVRNIVVDHNNLLWVIVGEWGEDNQAFRKLMLTIDIFNTDGEFLYTFETDKFTFGSAIIKDRMYAHPTEVYNKIIGYTIINKLSN